MRIMQTREILRNSFVFEEESKLIGADQFTRKSNSKLSLPFYLEDVQIKHHAVVDEKNPFVVFVLELRSKFSRHRCIKKFDSFQALHNEVSTKNLIIC